MKLTQRDLHVLSMVKNLAFALTSQVARLFFPNEKVASRRLHKLSRAGFINHIEMPSMTKGKGEFAYYLSLKGCRQTDGSAVQPSSIKDLSHTLCVNGFIVETILECRKAYLEIEFIKDAFLRKAKRFEAFIRAKSVHTKTMFPDVVLSIRNENGRKALFFVEVERATIPIESRRFTSIKEKVEIMAAYIDNGVFGFFNDVFNADFSGFRYLILTSGGEERISNIISACYDEKQDLDFVWLAPFDSITKGLIAEAIWRRLNMDDKNFYSIFTGSPNTDTLEQTNAGNE